LYRDEKLGVEQPPTRWPAGLRDADARLITVGELDAGLRAWFAFPWQGLVVY